MLRRPPTLLSSHRHGSRASAFSVIELLLVLSILVLIAALTIPAVDRWQRERPIHEAADQLHDELRHSRVRAIDQGVPIAFRFRAGTSEFVIEAGEPPQVRVGQIPQTVHFGPRGTEANDWSAPLWFHSNGTAMETSLELVDEEGRTQRLLVRRLTGGVVIE